MNYWVVINKERRGPITLEELKSQSGLTEDSYVWHEGLTQWTHARDIEELSSLFSVSREEVVPTENTVTPIATTDTATDVADSTATDEPQQPMEQHFEEQQPEQESQPAEQEKQAEQQWYNYTSSMPDMQNCPPTFLALSIVMLICCCQLFGIVAVVYSSQVRSVYLSGNIEKAERYSRNALIWCVVSLFAGLISIPLSILWSIYSVAL